MSPIAASSAIAVTTLTPGIVISRSASGSLSASAPRNPVELLELAGQKVDLAQAGAHRQPLVQRQPDDLRGQPPPALATEQVADRRPAQQVALKHRMNLVLGARPRPHQRTAAGDQPPPRLRPVVRCPHLIEEPDARLSNAERAEL